MECRVRRPVFYCDGCGGEYCDFCGQPHECPSCDQWIACYRCWEHGCGRCGFISWDYVTSSDESSEDEIHVKEESGDSDASQLAVNAYGEPQSAAANDEGTPHEDALLALPSVCTFQQVLEMQPMKGIGGKTACAKQRELRQVCLQNGVGRREAVLALTVLLNECWNNEAGAVDITDGHGFDWKRFVANTMDHLEIATMGLEKIFALRTAVSGSPKLAFCTTGTTWKILDPTGLGRYKNTRLPVLQGMSSDWRLEPLFLQTLPSWGI